MRVLSILWFAFFLTSCSSSSGTDSNTSDEWLIPVSQVFDGGPGKDGIPALENPEFISVAQANYLVDDDLVVGVKIGSDIRAYPHRVLNWHEIVNDTYGSEKVAINYCPLTGSAMLWNESSSATDPTFGVSGLLYNSNLILYDRETDTNWSQMLVMAVNGERAGDTPTTRSVIETTWLNWRTMYPTTTVLSTSTGFSRNYALYPYGSFRTDTNLLFPIEHEDSRLHPKLRVLGVLTQGVNKVYPLDQFASGINVRQEQADNYVVIGSSDLNFAAAFSSTTKDGTPLTFSAINHALPIVMQDNETNQWDIFGAAVTGPRTGEQLPVMNSYIAYWFAWASFFPQPDIHF